MIRIMKTAVLALALLVVFITGQTVIEYKLDRLKEARTTASPVTAELRQRQLDCLARNIYHEAGYEPFEGKVAVAQVTINRVNSGKFPDDICDVVFQKTKFTDRVVCQFSWYCERGPVVPKKSPAYIESQEVAKKVLLENFRLPSLHGALYYHADYVNPNWKLPRITKIGQHIFYGENK